MQPQARQGAAAGAQHHRCSASPILPATGWDTSPRQRARVPTATPSRGVAKPVLPGQVGSKAAGAGAVPRSCLGSMPEAHLSHSSQLQHPSAGRNAYKVRKCMRNKPLKIQKETVVSHCLPEAQHHRPPPSFQIIFMQTLPNAVSLLRIFSSHLCS